MSPIVIGALSIPALLVLLALRVHVAVALAVTGFVGLWAMTGQLTVAMGVLTTTPYTSVANFALAVVPLYILMGVWVGEAGVADGAYRAAQAWFGRLPAGLAIATVGANAVFGAACGSSSAACAVFSKVSLPPMRRHGYEKGFAGATIAAAGALAMLIPPSGLMIIYGILTQESIGDLFIAGIIPGLLLALFLSLTAVLLVRFRPAFVWADPDVGGMTERVSWRERIASLRDVWGVLLMMAIVIGGIYAGIFTPTEAGAVGALAALLLAIFVGRVGGRDIWRSLQEAGATTAMIFFVIIGAQIYAKFLALSGLPEEVIRWASAMNLSPVGLVIASVIIYIFLGTLMDAIAMMTITLPIIVPILAALGQDPIWFGIVAILAMELGLITPPFALDVFVVKASSEGQLRMEEIFRSAFPYYAAFIIVIAILIAFPWIVTWPLSRP